MILKNKIVLVTGSSQGIGSAIALAFVAEGANVVFNYRNTKDQAEKVFAQAQALGGDHLLVQADVSQEDQVKTLFQKIQEKYGHVDILVNNAGDADSIDLVKAPLEKWQYQMSNNFFSAVLCSQAFLKMSGSEKLRKIINISSVWGFPEMCHADYMAYGASKAALNSLTVNMAKKFAPDVLVNAIAPGFVLTPHWGEMSEQEQKAEGDQQLIERFITPEEIASGAVFLAHNDSLTGSVIRMDGGVGLKSI